MCWKDVLQSHVKWITPLLATESLIIHLLRFAVALHTLCPSLIMCLLWGGECRTHPTNRIRSCLSDSFIHPFPIAATCASNINKRNVLFLFISFNCIVENGAALGNGLTCLQASWFFFYFCMWLSAAQRETFVWIQLMAGQPLARWKWSVSMENPGSLHPGGKGAKAKWFCFYAQCRFF